MLAEQVLAALPALPNGAAASCSPWVFGAEGSY